MSRAMHTAVAVDYPYSDGRPMAESEAQLRAMLHVLGVRPPPSNGPLLSCTKSFPRTISSAVAPSMVKPSPVSASMSACA